MASLSRLSGNTIVISGGCGDIAQATARRLLQEGARVALLDLAPKDALSPDLAGNPSVTYLHCDITDRPSVDTAIDHVRKAHPHLDAVIANAGMVANEPFLEVDPARLRTTMDVNFFGASILPRQLPG